MRVAISSCKGGSGKTTTAAIIINSMLKTGKKVLAIDMDCRNHSLSFFYNNKYEYEVTYDKNIFQVFAGSDISDNILQIDENLDIIVSDVRLSDFRSIDTFQRLQGQIAKLQDKYDMIIYDCSPTYDNIITNVYYASDMIVIPCIPDMFNFQSLKYLLSKIDELDIKIDVNILFNQFEAPRTTNNKTYSNQIINAFYKDDTIFPHLLKNAISKSNNIKKYINDTDFKLTDAKTTLKSFKEIKNIMAEIFNVNIRGI